MDYIRYHNIEEAWKITKGEGSIVAILDWSFDLKGREEAKYIHPVSLVEGEEIGEMKPWHGEWMAEIVHSIAPEAKIIPIRTNNFGKYQGRVAKGIRYAADHGAVAVTSSMGPLIYTDEIREAIDYAEEHGTVFIDVHPEYIIQSDNSKSICKGSDCDPRIIHTGVVSVPDHPVDEPDPNRQLYTWPYDLNAVYKDGWGYSNAPPVVAGVIALMKSANKPMDISTIRKIIVETAEIRDGFPVVDAAKAVRVTK